MAIDPTVMLRRLIDEPTEATYTDVELNDRLTEASSDQRVVALDIWREKMAAAASLVNTSEGGSSRSMSQAFDHAAKMVEHFEALVARDSVAGRPVIHKLVRPKSAS